MLFVIFFENSSKMDSNIAYIQYNIAKIQNKIHNLIKNNKIFSIQ